MRSQQIDKTETAITFLNTLEDTTGLSSALLKPCPSRSNCFPVYPHPAGDPQSPFGSPTLPSLHLHLAQELKPEVKWFTHLCRDEQHHFLLAPHVNYSPL